MDVKVSTKVSASQRLSNLRDRLNTVDLIPLQLPAANNECLVSKNNSNISNLIKYQGTPAVQIGNAKVL